MARRLRSQATVKELPPCSGPKLHIFKNYHLPIRWRERLDDEEDANPGTEGYVFRAEIGSQQYAIKVFKFFDPMTTHYYWEPLFDDDPPLEEISYHTDPFFAECRAYGRIHEGIKKSKRNAQIAVTCHGFLLLTADDEQELYDRGVKLGLDDIDVSFQQRLEGGCRVRAIIKELAVGSSGVNKKSAASVLNNIKAMNRLKIYNKDIRSANYINGQIVDFGTSWTEPHCLLDALHERGAQSAKREDLVRFDEMMEDERINTSFRGVANPDYRIKLRSWDI